MNAQQFRVFCQECVDDEEKTLEFKRNEYSGDECIRFSNFYTMSKLSPLVRDNSSPENALYQSMVKHLAWWIDFMNGEVKADKNIIRDHFKDIHNLLRLQEAMYVENLTQF